MSIIICGYPGIGKSTAAVNRSNIIDAESVSFSHTWDPDTCFQEPNDAFPGNYVDYLEMLTHQLAGYDYILAACHQEVRDELMKRGIPFIVVMPDESCLNEYLIWYLKRGDSVEFITKMQKEWKQWHYDIRSTGATVITLGPGENLADILPK